MSALDELQLAARTMRQSVKDKSYRQYPMGQEAGAYLRWKRGMITAATYRDYESCLDKLARYYPDLELSDFTPPKGVDLLEEFLDRHWGDQAPRTYNKNLSVVKDFFAWAADHDRVTGNAASRLKPHKKRDVHREVFATDRIAQIIAAGPSDEWIYRDRVALTLLLKYGIRKGTLQAIQFKHFDRTRRRLTVFSKGEKVRELPIVDEALWEDLGHHQALVAADPSDYLLCRRKKIWRHYVDNNPNKGSVFEHKSYPDQPMGAHGLHDWWYACLSRAGVVAEGVTSGEKMHKARHSAGQAVLDQTGNIKAVQMLLGHADPSTTMQHYVDWDIDRLEETLRGLE